MARVDYTTIVKAGEPRSQQTGDNRPLRWWLESGSEQIAEGITASIAAMKGRQAARELQYAVGARLYGNVAFLGAAQQPRQQVPLLRDRLSYNAVQSAIDTVVAKMSKNKPRPLFLTSGGDYKLQRKAKKLNQFVDGLFYEVEAYKMGVESLREGAVNGDGVVFVFPHNGRVAWERVSPLELWVDEQDGWYGQPRQLHRTKRIDKAVLRELATSWMKDADAKERERAFARIDSAEVEMLDSPGLGTNAVANLVLVRESWHLPDGQVKDSDEDTKGGAHVISIEGCVLLSEPYRRSFFPFARFRWSPRLWGYWSQGGAEQVQNLQIEINKLLWIIQRSYHLAGSYKILIENSSKVVSEKINNDIGAIIRYAGPTPPQYVVPPVVPPEIYQHLNTLKSAVYEQLGVSLLSASAKKPDGLNSGKALREYNDIESDRFQVVGQEYERFFVELAKVAIAVVKDIARENGGHYSVRAPNGKRQLDLLDWSEVQLDEDSYVMQAFPVSSLPQEPAARYEQIQEWVQAGWITPRQGRRLMDFPDLETAEGLANAAEDYLTLILEEMTDGGDYRAPEPYDDLKLGFELALEYYQRGKVQGLPDEDLEKLRRFMAQIEQLQKLAMPPPPVIGPPQVGPEPAPTSPLVPNQPGVVGAPGPGAPVPGPMAAAA